MSHVDDLAVSIAATQHGLVTRRELRAAGVAASTISRRLTSGRWRSAAPGVYVLPGFPPAFEQDVATWTLADPTRAASHRTAAHLLELYRSPQPREIEVARLRDEPRLPLDVIDVTSHETLWLPEEEVVLVGAIRTTSAARTIVDLAARSSDDRVRDLIHDALRRQLCDRDEVIRVAHARPRLNGVCRIRRVVDSLHPEAEKLESPLEVAGLAALRSIGLPYPDLQVEVRGRDGRLLGRVDAAYPAARLAIEFDGAAWHSTPSDQRRDAARQRAIEAEGWRVLRLGWADLRAADRLQLDRRVKSAFAASSPDDAIAGALPHRR